MLDVLNYIDIPFEIREEWENNLSHSKGLQNFETERVVKWLKTLDNKKAEYAEYYRDLPTDSKLKENAMKEISHLSYMVWKYSKYLEMKVTEYNFLNN